MIAYISYIKEITFLEKKFILKSDFPLNILNGNLYSSLSNNVRQTAREKMILFNLPV
jgi:hypothetical protein